MSSKFQKRVEEGRELKKMLRLYIKEATGVNKHFQFNRTTVINCI